MKQIQLILSGKVHNVFFRDSTKRVATQLGLKGFVRNLKNGDVEVVAQGDQAQLSQLIEFCKNGPSGAKVDNIEIKNQGIIEEFQEFKIKY